MGDYQSKKAMTRIEISAPKIVPNLTLLSLDVAELWVVPVAVEAELVVPVAAWDVGVGVHGVQLVDVEDATAAADGDDDDDDDDDDDRTVRVKLANDCEKSAFGNGSNDVRTFFSERDHSRDKDKNDIEDSQKIRKTMKKKRYAYLNYNCYSYSIR